VTTIDATFRLYCDESHSDGRPTELWLARETVVGRHIWRFSIPSKFHGRDWNAPDGPRDLKVTVQRLRGDTFLIKEMREPYSDFVFTNPHIKFSDTPKRPDRMNFRFKCPTCGISPPVRSEKLARILNRQITAGLPEMSLRGLDYMLKLLP
jgi:hypothetical protein